MIPSQHHRLWQQLAQQHIVSGEPPETEQNTSPWYVRTMLGIAGWIGALMLLGAFFAGFEGIIDSPAMAALIGGSIILLAVVIYRQARHSDFADQFAFALSLAGQGLLSFSIFSGLSLLLDTLGFIQPVRIFATLLFVLQAILLFIVPNYLHRLWSSFIGVGALVFLANQFGLYPLTLACLLAVTVWLWLQELRWPKHSEIVHALGYSMIVLCILHLLTQNHFWDNGRFWQNEFGVQPLGGEYGNLLAAVGVGLVLLALVIVLLKRESVSLFSGVGLSALLLAVMVAASGTQAPGISVAVVIILLGFSGANRVLTVLGLVTFVAFLSQYYYQLHLTLLHKSIVLVVSGLLLLLMRQGLRYFWPRGVVHA